ncbi:MAG: hypothetical protein JWQ49_2378 [Edaphobacter sp.]|nr:hypothetical protein [Edaphobacter sp.]
MDLKRHLDAGRRDHSVIRDADQELVAWLETRTKLESCGLGAYQLLPKKLRLLLNFVQIALRNLRLCCGFPEGLIHNVQLAAGDVGIDRCRCKGQPCPYYEPDLLTMDFPPPEMLPPLFTLFDM